MIKLGTICFALMLTVNCLGQTTNQQQVQKDYELLYAGPHFSASLIPYLTQKAAITTQSGNYAPTSTNMIGGEAGVNYHLHFNEAYSLIIGLHVGVGGRNHHLFIAKEEFTPQLNRDVVQDGSFNRDGTLYFALPVWVERRWQHKGGNHWNVSGGVNVRHVTETFFQYYSLHGDVSGGMVRVADFDLMVGNKRKPWLNFNFGGGYSWLLGNRNFLRLNLLANYSTTNMVYGDYIINVTGKEPTVGRYTANLSYLGLSVNYIFTGASKIRKKLRQREATANTKVSKSWAE